MAKNKKKAEFKWSEYFRILKTFKRHYRKYWKILAVAWSSLLVTTLLTVAKPWPIKLVLDYVLLKEPLPGHLSFLNSMMEVRWIWVLAIVSSFVLLIAFLDSTFSYINKYFIAVAGEKIVADIRERIFGHLQSLSLSFHDNYRSGDLVYRLTSDVKDLKKILIDSIQDIGNRILSISAITITMLLMDWRLGLVAFAVVPILFVFTKHFSEEVTIASKKKKKKESEVASTVQEIMSSIAMVQAYGQEDREMKRFAGQNQKSLESELRAIKLSKTFKRVSQMTIATGTFLVLFYGGTRVISGAISVGDLVVFVSYLKSLYGPIDKFTLLLIQQAKALASGERVVELVEKDLVLEDAPDAVEAPLFKGKVDFNNVSFAYKNGKPVLRNLNIHVLPGQTIALVGHSGAGKSTLVRLLLRFFDPIEGEVLIDDVPLRKFKLKSLRRQMTIVMQDAILFRKTIRENIAFGRPDASDEDIINAARKAQIHDFITSLPRGYDTMIDERGENLSGGQKQRLSIARAIIRDAPILIFDEPTTGLDASLEAEISKAIENMTEGRTSFVIAHRFSTIMKADQILLLEEGAIAEQGTHDQLMKQNDRYRKLFEMQFPAVSPANA